MVTRTFTIYEVPNSYVLSGTSGSILATFSLTVIDDDGFLNGTAAGDTGTAQVLTSDAGTIDSYEFFYDDITQVDGVSQTIKTLQLNIDGTTHSFIMNDTGDSIPGAVVGSPVVLNTFASYTALNYNAIPCFTAGTCLTTDQGEVAVEDLRPGSLVRTFDHGLQPVRWIGSVHLTRRELLAGQGPVPVRIEAGALGPHMPARALSVSPQHRILLEGWDIELHFGCDEALAPAKSLLERPGISSVIPDEGVTYFHILFDRHEIVFSEGLATESFFVGDTIRAGMDGEQLAEIMILFPQLGHQYGPLSETARMVLRAGEVDSLYAGVA